MSALLKIGGLSKSFGGFAALTDESAVKPPNCFDTAFTWRSGASIS